VTAGLGGLPARRPDQTRDYPPTGVQPGAGNVVRARLVIISGTAGGLFVYNGTPALGNPPIVSATAASTDPYGNPVTPGLDVTQGSITGTLISASQIDGTAITGSVFEGTDFTLNDDGLFIYSGVSGPLLGANKGSYATVDAAVGTLPAYRGYGYPADGIPASWPGSDAAPVPAGVTMPVISFYPPQIDSGAFYDITGMAGGTYDAELIAYFSLVPANALVACFHEGESNTYGAGKPAPVRNGTEATYVAMHEHLYALFHMHAAAGARYGQIFSSYSSNPASSSYPLSNWVAPGMDFYGIDGYQGGGSDTIANTFGTSLTQIEVVQSSPVIAIPETNSYLEADRPAWFADVAAWAPDALCLCTFWASGTYAWVPDDIATISELEAINTASAIVLVASVAAADGTDADGNAYLDGFASYVEAGGTWYASQLYGGFLTFWTASSAAGPWMQQGQIQGDSAGNLLLNPPVVGASVSAGGPLDVDGGITAQGGITWESPGLITYAAEGGSGASFTVNTVTTATPGNLAEETIPSGDPVAGSIYRLTAFGEGQWSSAQEQLNLFLNLAGNAVAEVGIGATAFADSAAFWWEADGTVCCKATGATATWTGRLRITVTQTANAATGFNSAANSVTAAGNTGSATVTASTEAPAVFQLAAVWAATTGAPTISKYTSYFEKVF
jgi:hypothetical protein